MKVCHYKKKIISSVVTEDRKQFFFHVPRLAYRSQLTAFNFFYDDNLQQLKIADQISRKTPYGPSENSESVRQYARIG